MRQNSVTPKVSEHALNVFNGCEATPDDADKVIELYDTLQSPLRAYLGTFGLSADEVDDVIQEVFVRLMRHLRNNGNGVKLRQLWDENQRGWLFRVAHNFVMDIYRNSQRAPHLSRHDVEFLLSHRADPALDPEQNLLRKEKLARLDAAISKLDIEQRSCLLLRAQGLRHKEIGSELGISAQQASKLLQQGLGQLAGELRS
jgi:RNA polymerase sigma-70 factor, ECF subfamily